MCIGPWDSKMQRTEEEEGKKLKKTREGDRDEMEVQVNPYLIFTPTTIFKRKFICRIIIFLFHLWIEVNERTDRLVWAKEIDVACATGRARVRVRGNGVEGRARVTQRWNKISIENLCLWHFGEWVHLGIWCRAISIDSITFIFNPSNFLFALSLSLTRFYLCCIDSPDPYTHTYPWLFVFVTFNAPFASIQLCACLPRELTIFFGFFVFLSQHSGSDGIFNVVIFKERERERILAHRHSFNQSHIPNGNILWWILL